MLSIRHPRVHIALNLNSSPGRNELFGIMQYVKQSLSWDMRLAFNVEQLNSEITAPNVEGLIIGLLHDDKTLDFVARTEIPTVVIDIGADRIGNRQKNIAYITTDNISAGTLAANHFHSYGLFRSFAFVTPNAPRPWAELRQQAFVSELRTKGVVTKIFSAGTADRHLALQRFLKELDKPAAVFASHDIVAQEVIFAAHDAQIAIPRQISVLGVDNDDFLCDTTTPPLSSIRPDYEREGFIAARELNRLITSRARRLARPRVFNVPITGVVERESTDRPPPVAHLIDRALDYIRSHANQSITPGEVAKQLHISRRLLDMRFHSFASTTVAAAIRDARLEQLQKLLVSAPTRPISVITDSLGFSNPRSVMKLFARQFGMTMRDYRKKFTKS